MLMLLWLRYLLTFKSGGGAPPASYATGSLSESGIFERIVYCLLVSSIGGAGPWQIYALSECSC